jgi:glycosyltransferase involved in cell wall biosynthesis
LKLDSKYVVYIVPGIYPCSTGGMELFYHHLIPEIAKKLNVIMITSCNKVHAIDFTIIKIPDRIISIPGTARFAVLFFTAVNLIKMRKKIAVVHLPYTSNAGKWGFIMPVLRRFFGIRYLLHIHGGGMRKWKRMNADQALFINAEKILAVSEVTRTEYEKRSGRDIQVVFPMVPFKMVEKDKEEARAELGFNADDRIILFVGSLKGLKAPDVLLNAFILLGDQYIQEQKLKLVFVGDGVLKTQLKSAILQHGFEESVIIKGKVQNELVPPYYRAADIYVIPSHFEGTSKSLLEAMHSGLPIIGSDVNGINNLLENNRDAFLFIPNDPEDLSKQIDKLIRNPQVMIALGAKAIEKYNKLFSFEKTIDDLTNIYQENN